MPWWAELIRDTGLGALVILAAKSLLTHRLSKEVEAFKADLSHKTTTEVEQLKANLQHANAIHLERLKNYMQRDELRLGIYADYIQQITRMRDLYVEFQRQGEIEAQRVTEESGRMNRLNAMMCVLFSDEVKRLVGQLSLAARDANRRSEFTAMLVDLEKAVKETISKDLA